MASHRALIALSSLTLLLLLLEPARAIDSDFSFYPKDAQSCLYDSAAGANCGGGSLAALNTCLCGNNDDFIVKTARCLGQKDPDDVDDVYDTMAKACADSNTPIAVKEGRFKQEADRGASATTAATTGVATTTTTGGATVTVTPSSDADGDDGGLSSGAAIGIGVGGAAAGIAAIAGVAFYILRRRRRRGEESHPMLPHHNRDGSTTFPPVDPSPSLGASMQQHQQQEYYDKPTSSWIAPSPAPSSDRRWSDQTATTYATPGYSQPMVAELPPQPRAIFEMEAPLGNSPPPAELPEGAATTGGQQQQSGWPR